MNNKELWFFAKSVLAVECDALKLVNDNLNETFSDVVRQIAAAKKLIVSGVGKSGIIGRKIASTFASIGVPSYFMHPGDAMHGDLGMVESGDVCLLLSKSGSTKEILEMFPYLRSRGAMIVSITGNEKSYLTENSDFWLNSYVEEEGCPLNTAPMASALVSLAIGDALAASVMKLKNITVRDFSRQHPLGQIGRNLILSVKDVMHSGSKLPVVSEDATFKEAVIEITDKTLGCVCIVDKNNKLSGIITDGDVRRVLHNYDDINSLMAKDLMTSNPVSVSPDKLLGETLGVMENRKTQINVLPVVNERNDLLGIIRLHDIVKSNI
jgi:arabinose-5-phosphate isomerase